MDCPKCKCPNAPGATYCQMCYESLNRSAAESFIRNVRREHYEQQRRENDNSIDVKLSGFTGKIASFLEQIDWPGIAEFLRINLIRYKKAVALAAAALAALIVLLILHSPAIRFRALGHSFNYIFTAGGTQRYLTGFQTDYKSWSEWNRQLDTPMEEYHTDEIGNILVERVAASSGNMMLGFRPKEWILIHRSQTENASRGIALDDPSLAPFAVTMDSKGFLTHRPVVLSSRLGRTLDFVLPVFPTHALRLGNQWAESIQWVETIGDWKIYWKGQLHWTLNSAGECAEGTCAQLSFTGQLTPQLWSAPEWMNGVIGKPLFQVSPANGTAIFDLRHHRLVSNTMTYNAVMQVPIRDLGRIPWELRVGRRVRGVPGNIFVQLTNRLDVHEN